MSISFLTGKWTRNALPLTALCLALTGVGITVLTGCGGSNNSGSSSSSTGSSSVVTRSGRATITIKWPVATTRLIPVASSSITIRFIQNSQTVATQTVARPTSGDTTTTTFSALPTGTLTVQSTAYPNADGTGTAQAVGGTDVTITANQNTAVTVTMASTIQTLSLTPTTASVVVGATTALTASALDSSGAVVLTSPSKYTYVSSSTGVATVDGSGTVTGVAAGTSTITVTETESGKTATAAVTVTAAATPTPTPTATPTPTSGSTIVDLANAYINSLSSTQQTATVVDFTVANAEKWSNLPATPTSSGTTSLRNGVAYSTLTTAQQTAWTNLVSAALSANSSNGLTQESNIRAADADLRSAYNANGYSGDYQYVAFVGTPSTTGSWMLQLGGHHNAHNYYFIGTALQTTTPYHIGVEPTDFTLNGTTYSPLSDQKTAVTNLLSSMSTTQLSSAKISGSFGDLYLGAGQDARSDFPSATATTGRGILVTSLTSTQQDLVKAAINAWVKNSPQASTYESLYYSELGSTYVGYAGNSSAPGTVFTAQGDYLRIDGPHVWIEFVCQNGVVVQGKIHYHTIWRDRVTDYNAPTAGWTLYNHSN